MGEGMVGLEVVEGLVKVFEASVGKDVVMSIELLAALKAGIPLGVLGELSWLPSQEMVPLEATGFLDARGSLEAGGSLEAAGSLEAEGSLEVRGSLEAGGFLEA